LSSTGFLETMLLDECPCRSTVHAHRLPRHIVVLPYLTTTAWSCLSCLSCQDSMHVSASMICTCPSGASNVQCLPFCTVQDGSQQAVLSLGNSSLSLLALADAPVAGHCIYLMTDAPPVQPWSGHGSVFYLLCRGQCKEVVATDVTSKLSEDSSLV